MSSSELQTQRDCSGCTMCCKLYGISRLSKPPNKWCAHCEVGKGCLIYPERPEECRTFQCQWLQGFGDDALRPSASGVVIDLIELDYLGKVYGMWEMLEGALAGEAINNATRSALSNGFLICHVSFLGEWKLLKPEGVNLLEEAETQLIAEGVEIVSITQS